jgi:ribosomal protein S18 acetylase RimI-like enzyme
MNPPHEVQFGDIHFRDTHFRELSPEEFREYLPRALEIYVEAMRYPAGTGEQRAPIWLAHVLRAGWRCTAAFDTQGKLIGFAYGYQGSSDQWWYDQVRKGLLATNDHDLISEWLADYFELTEIHIQPARQGRGIGEILLRRLVEGLPQRKVLLSTPEGTSRAWKLYRRMGFVDVLRNYYFAGDLRPFAVLGRGLPLDPSNDPLTDPSTDQPK